MDSGLKEDSRNFYLLTFSAVSNQTKWYYDEIACLRTWASGVGGGETERDRERDRDRDRARQTNRQTDKQTDN